MTTNTTPSASSLVRFAPYLICLIPLAAFPLANWLAVGPFGSEISLILASLLAIPALLAFFGLPVFLLLALFRKTRAFGLHTAALALAFILCTYAGIRIGSSIRLAAFDQLAERSMPLIAAIETYTREKSHPPATLQDLVPDYLPAIPTTGMAAYPDYEYHADTEAPEDYLGNPWALVVFARTGLFSFDQFLYLPNQNYPGEAFGGHIERMGKWGYVHE